MRFLPLSLIFSCLFLLCLYYFVCFWRTPSQLQVPNIAVEWLTHLFRIREVPGSNLGPDTGYPDWGFSWFSSVLPGICWDNTLKLDHDRFLPHPCQLIILLSPLHSMLWINEKASLNKLQKLSCRNEIERWWIWSDNDLELLDGCYLCDTIRHSPGGTEDNRGKPQDSQ
jgi:hypothetical protein